MKIKDKHYAHIVDSIRPLKSQFASYKNILKQDLLIKDLEKRFRWDMAYKANLLKFICDEIYQYANDVHIDTALRMAIAEIEGA